MSVAHVTAVLVLYRMTTEESPCFRSLRDLLQETPFDGFCLLLYDNSPDASEAPAFPAPLLYRHDPTNGGVAAAYKTGLNEARANGSEWLLLLDQDTTLTAGYMDELRTTLPTVPGEVVAVVPRLVEGDQTLSPQFLPRLSHRALPENMTGVLRETVSAFNSGACLRVSALTRFPDNYRMDFLDHVTFHQLQANGGRLYLTRARLEHSLSTHQLAGEESLRRYRIMLWAERDFYREYGSITVRIFYHLRRIKQTAGHLIKVPDKRFARLSAQAAFGLLGPSPSRMQQR